MSTKSTKSIPWFSRWTLTPALMSEDPLAVRHSLIRLLAATDRNSLDAGKALKLFSQEQWGIQRFRLNRFVHELDKTKSLLDSLEKHPTLLGEHAMVALRLGQATGTLPAAWKELTISERPIHTESTRIWRNSKTYWFAVGFAIMCLSLLIGPNFKVLTREFGLPSDNSMLVMHLDSFIYLGIASALVLFTCWIAWRCATWNSQSWLSRFAARFGGNEARQEAGIWRLIATNLEEGVPAKTTIDQLARLHMDERMRHKLGIVNDSIQGGTEEWSSMVQVKLLHPTERGAITASSYPDVQAWTLRHLALRRREDLHFRSLRRNMWIQPIMTLLFGLFVLMIGYAVFSTLSNLILLLSERHG